MKYLIFILVAISFPAFSDESTIRVNQGDIRRYMVNNLADAEIVCGDKKPHTLAGIPNGFSRSIDMHVDGKVYHYGEFGGSDMIGTDVCESERKYLEEMKEKAGDKKYLLIIGSRAGGGHYIPLDGSMKCVLSPKEQPYTITTPGCTTGTQVMRVMCGGGNWEVSVACGAEIKDPTECFHTQYASKDVGLGKDDNSPKAAK